MNQRIIPSTGEKLNPVGLGTYIKFDVEPDEVNLSKLQKLMEAFIQNGGSIIDSSPMYGNSEKILGLLSERIPLLKKHFLATKVWTSGKESGISQMTHSLQLLNRNEIELMQIHNLVDFKSHLKTLYDWKERGRIKYIGITHYLDSAHDRLIDILKPESIDFVQFNYSIGDRNAEKRLLPFCRDNKIATIINEPFEKGSLFRSVKGKALPEIARDYGISTWAQYFLKYILSHPAVTCVIPATSKVNHLLENLEAGKGNYPGEAEKKEMLKILNQK
ncbi:MAG: aldo/keto reductase [Leptospiraceae bacterium]|nr:aldo/keto reductase [Leptospiraceae bacterium]MCP5513152.1 aldo/keto reductase [Leptospiraceae bacterium]